MTNAKGEERAEDTVHHGGGGAWPQEHEAATHMTSTAREMDAGAQLTLAFLCGPDSELLEWCCSKGACSVIKCCDQKQQREGIAYCS